MATNKSQLEKWLTAQTGKDRQSQARTVENANFGKKTAGRHYPRLFYGK